MSDEVDLKDGRTAAEKTLLDELCAIRAANAELVRRLSLAHSALHVEQHAHEQTKASLLRIQREKREK